ncbi:decarboxylating NADP(+)-dependent phosphogluconate dehydrogenase [Truepera radiovictrix]|nr:decarboxylating NADP(+)-dependent phosphogluconate dehydrogenase [Truepera radiovictrix]WMT56806.1 decarboxylating NADP(+)-dependent phosphogluconate dehydrogenase [Truepera radiovictrix]
MRPERHLEDVMCPPTPETPPQAELGLIGLAVMGRNLVLNLADHGYTVAVFNRTTQRMTDFLEGEAKGRSVVGYERLEDFVGALERPRKVMLMVEAGRGVDAVIGALLPLLEPGDVIIDGGNSNFLDTRRRERDLRERGIHFLGVGISGGEEGARHGPSIMPGGSREAWELVRPILQRVAAHVGGAPCCDYVGEDGAGHFVKMVHNGIEYGDMQLIGEAYDLMRSVLGMNADELAETFARWNEGPLNSYLIDITATIFRVRDRDGTPLVENILDVAGQKGTGRWTVVAALEEGVPLTLIAEAVFARSLSALKSERVAAAAHLTGPAPSAAPEREAVLADLEAALYAAKITSYAQGYMLLRAAAKTYGWSLNYGGVAQMWRGGCIIRSAFLDHIKAAYDADPELPNLLLAPYFRDAVTRAQGAWRRTVAFGVQHGVPLPAFGAALAFFDGLRRATGPANLLQAQRDFFGAHTFERVDGPRGTFYHADWLGQGGGTSDGGGA